MKKNSIKKRILISLLAIGTLFSLASINTIDATENGDSSNIAPLSTSEPAFPASSQPLHDAILSIYPAVDGADGSVKDGVISKSEAAAWTGTKIHVRNLGLAGTITGIEYFTNPNLSSLYLDKNQFTGEIPSGLGSMSGLTVLNLSENHLSGSIPSDIGQLSNLQSLHLHTNNLSGSIPTTFGNLGSLEQLAISFNQLTGSIPEELGNCSSLRQILLHSNLLSGSIPESIGYLPLTRISINKNNLSGEVPDSLFTNSTLKTLELCDNAGLTGNPAEKIPADSQLTKVRIQGTDMIQAPVYTTNLDESTGGIFVYDDLAENLLNTDLSGPAEGITQEDIKKAQESADWISDPTEKQKWQDNIDLAQSMLDAQTGVGNLLNDTRTDVLDNVTQETIDDAKELIKILPDGQFKTDLQADIDLAQEFLNNRTSAQAKVDALFTDSTHEDIKDITNQDTINDALAVVNALPDGSFKENLLAEVAKAQSMLDAKAVVENLFTDSTHTDIKDTTDQAVIDNAKIVVNKLPDGKLKTELMAEIDKAQDMLNAKNVVGNLLDDEGKLSDGVTQEDIDNAQDLVNKLPNGDLKDELQDIIDDAQKQLDDSNKVPVVTNPSTPGTNPPVVSKPSISGETSTTTDVTKNVNTGDTTNLSLYGGLLLLSLCGFVVVTKRRKAVK
ncbi:toxin Cry1Ac domain D-VI-related protein [Breznakia pachnodae]|uniref:LPXTG-motif cell wall-anchored protein n=1 Tax=Breznakia pachnodae TaxID=265178 RepID=A0ABU0E2M2_9FIRM|nr:toxin Cry1Ac domain D-VI-related protein [Breznakia pachnodae]MDQ0361134.1 LPXTG-motif cell wall-anchored protein [Breznakia pachnodae]